jgi:hypothetical protein
MSDVQTELDGATLAARVEEVWAKLIQTVEPCSEQQWRTICPEEGRTVGVMVHHIASSAPLVASWAELVATGQALPPISMEQIHNLNMQHADKNAYCSKEETLALLRRNGRSVAAMIRRLSADQLSRSTPFAIFGGQPTSAREIVEMVVIGHIDGYPHSHLDKIEAAIAR